MSSIVAIERGKSSLAVAVADKHATGATLAHCAKIELPPSAGPAEIEDALRVALPHTRWAKAALVVVVGGDDAQLRPLQLPPAPAEELPSIVRMLAAKDLGATEEDAVDFLPIHSDEHGHSVVAAKIAEAKLAELEQLAKRLDATLKHVVLRPCASASLVMRVAPEVGAGSCLIVTPASGGADLVAVQDGSPVLMRSTQGGSHTALQADIRRTLPVASQLLGGAPDSILALGSPAEETKQPASSGDIAMRVVDLADEALTSKALKSLEDRGWPALVGVMGAALEAASGQSPAIDFVNPRQANGQQVDRRRQLLLAGAAAAAVVLGLFMAYGKLVAMDRQIADLQAGIDRLDDSTETFAPYQKQVAQLEAWFATDVTWLDELEVLGRRLRPQLLSADDYPASDDVYLTELLLRPPTRGVKGGQIELKGVARSAAAPGRVEQRLRDERHSIQPISVSERPAGGKYATSFTTLIRIEEATSPASTDPASPDAAREETPAEETEEAPEASPEGDPTAPAATEAPAADASKDEEGADE